MANSVKNLKTNKYVIVIIILGIVFFALFITLLVLSFRKNNVQTINPTKNPEPTGNPLTNYMLPDNTNLARDNNFYKEKHQDTLKYLLAVYPTAQESLEKMNYIEIALFYNSLWFYYNCSSSFNKRFGFYCGTNCKEGEICCGTKCIKNDGKESCMIGYEVKDKNKNTIMMKNPDKHCWQPLPGCGDKYPKLPYTPQGYIYSFKHFIDNDWENFDWNSPKEDNWKPWILSDSTLDPSEITASLPGAAMWTNWNGPGPMFMYQRAIFRMVYNTELPKLRYIEDNNRTYRIPMVLPGAIEEFSSEWNYPKKWYQGGAPDNGYIEVTAADEPGMPISGAITWLDGWPGSGLFFNVGKSFRARNKCDGAFLLAQEMAKTPENKQKLINWYGSADPYDIISGLIGFKQGICRQSPVKVWDSVKNKKVEFNFCYPGAQGVNGSYATYPNGMNDLNHFDGNNWFTWCNDQTIVKNPLTKENQDAYNKIIEENPDISKYYKKDDKFNIDNIYNNSRLFSINNKCIDGARFEKILNKDGGIDYLNSYRAGRFAAQGGFDEAMTTMGVCLGYDSIQLIQSSNGNGFWQVEILDLKNLPEGVKDRDYSEYIRIGTEEELKKGERVFWRTDNDFVKNWMKEAYSRYSLRDPFDVNNDKKAKKCITSVNWDPKKVKWDYNMTCSDHISDMFTYTSIFGANDNGFWNFCSPDGAGFGSTKDKIVPMKDENTPPYA